MVKIVNSAFSERGYNGNEILWIYNKNLFKVPVEKLNEQLVFAEPLPEEVLSSLRGKDLTESAYIIECEGAYYLVDLIYEVDKEDREMTKSASVFRLIKKPFKDFWSDMIVFKYDKKTVISGLEAFFNLQPFDGDNCINDYTGKYLAQLLEDVPFKEGTKAVPKSYLLN